MTTSPDFDGAVQSLNVRSPGDEKLEQLKKDITANGLKNPVVVKREEPLSRGCRGARVLKPGLTAAAALVLMDGALRARVCREKTERVVVGEAIPRARKKGPKPPHVVERSKLPKRLFKSRPVVRVGDPETPA